MSSTRTRPSRWGRAAIAASMVFVLAACAQPSEAAPEDSGGPGGSGVVTAEPDAPAAADAVTTETACELAAASPTLQELGMEGYSYDTSFVAEASGCQLNITASPHEYSSFGLAVVTAEDVRLTATADPSVSNTTLVLLPDLGENGHFIGPTPGIEPATNPKSGSIVAADGELGISLSWSMMDSYIPFDTFVRAASEALAALP